jgi:cell division protein FtsA
MNNLRGVGVKKGARDYLFALDVGSKKLTLAAAQSGAAGEIGPIAVEVQPARGIFKGVVNDLASLTESVQEVLRKMERRLNVKAVTVGLSINGNYIEARNSVTAVALSERGTRSITRRDMERLNIQARSLGVELDEFLLHEIPQGYSIDRHNMTLNPLGLHGRKFEMDLLLVAARAAYVDNIAKSVERAGVDVGRVVYSGIAAAEAVLTSEDRENGAVLVDIGDALTGVIIFQNGIPRRLRIIAFGGKNLSEIIANYCRISSDIADSIVCGSLDIGSDMDETDEVMVKAQDGFCPVKARELAAVVLPEVDRFISMMKSSIFECGVPSVSGAKIVVTGGLSLLEGLLEKMEKDIGLSVRMGIPKDSGDIPVSQSPAYASAIGLLSLKAQSAAANSLLPQESRNMVGRAIDYVKHLYQDYF